MQGVVKGLLEPSSRARSSTCCRCRAHGGQPFLTPYSTGKGGTGDADQKCGQSYRINRIRCNAVLPGWMDTPNEDVVQKKWHNAPDDWLEKAEAAHPWANW